MKTCLAVILVGIIINDVTSMLHSLKYVHTSSSQVPNLPGFVSVGLVNDLQITHCDSITRSAGPRQDWMKRVSEDNPWFWEQGTQICLKNEQISKVNIEIVKQRLNQTGGVHINQMMSGCEWDDETDEIRGHVQFGFDGEDFISLDLETDTWVAAKQEAVITKHKWEGTGETARYKKYINNDCAYWLKYYVRYGEKTLKRTERPLVSLLQKSSSSPVTCHATGFYPDTAEMFWTKDGEDVFEGVDLGEILPNKDGTYQMSVDLDVSSVPSEDWDRYVCVFKLSGVRDDLTRLDRAKIRTNEKESMCPADVGVFYCAVIFAGGPALLLLLLLLLLIVLIRKYKCFSGKKIPVSPRETEVVEKLNPDKDTSGPSQPQRLHNDL